MKQTVAIFSIIILAIACRREETTTTITGETIASTAVETAASAPPPADAPLATGTAAATAATSTSTTTATTTLPLPDKQTHVRLTEYRIEMPDSLTAGTTIFHVVNEGKEKHSFEIEGEGMEWELDRELDPGATGTLQVDLRAGSYRVYCPVANHATEHGMSRQLTVR